MAYTVFPLPVVDAGLPTSVCSNQTVSITATANGGTGALSYTWTPANGIISGQGTNSIQIDTTIGSDPAVQVYTLAVSDQNNCTVFDVTTLNIDTLPIVNAGPDTVLCNQPIAYPLQGFSPLTGAGGTGVWSGSAALTGSNFTPNGIGSFTLTYTFTDNNTCSASDQVDITVIPPIFPNAGVDFGICNNAAAVQLQPISIPGGTWSGSGVNVSGLFNPSSVAPGTYTLVYTINDGTTCETTDALEVTVFPIPQIESLSEEVCSGLTIEIEPSVSGGTQPYAYQWSPSAGVLGSLNQSSISVSHIQPAPNDTVYTYSLSVTDNNNCVVVAQQNLTVNPLPVVIAGPDSILCNQPIPYPLQGFSPLSGPTGTGVWSGSPNLSGLEFNPNGTGTVQLTYTFTDTNGCINSDGVTLTINDPQFPDAGVDLGICNNAATVQLQPITFPGGFWSGNGINSAGVFDPSSVAPGVYTLVYTINDGTTCETTDELDVTVFEVPNVGSLTASVCSFDSVTLAPTVSAGTTPYSYTWSPTNGIVGPVNQSSAVVSLFQPPPSNAQYIYTLTVTDLNNCIASNAVNLTVNPLPVVNVGPDLSTCFSPGVPFQILNSITPPGGTWISFPGNIGTLNGLDFQTGGVGLDSLSYSFTDNNGCSNADTLVIDVVSPISVEVGPPMALCETDAVFDLPMPLPLNPPANYTTTWIGNGVELINGVHRFNPALADAGVNTLNYSFQEVGNTCAAGDELQIYIGTVPQLILPDVSICTGLDTNLTVTLANGSGTAPFTYQWVPNPALSAINTASTVYSALNNSGTAQNDVLNITVTDSVGCVGSLSSTITINPLPVVEAGPDSTLCNQPIIYPLGGYSPTVGGTGVWSGSPNLSGDEFTPNGLGVVNLTYTFTDDNGCVNSDQVSLTVVAPVFPNAGPDEDFCLTDAVFNLLPQTQPGGVWSGPGVSQVGGLWQFDASIANVGSHTISYTINTGTTCETSDTRTFNVWPMPDADAGIDIEQCSGVSFSLTGSAEPGTGTGPFQYQWTPSTGLTAPTNASTVNGSLINPGPTSVVQEYFVTVIDSKGCSSIDSMEVTINPLPDVEAGPDSTLCNQPIVYLLGGYSPTAGGTGVWSGSPNLSGDEFTPNGLGVVNLTYTFTDDNGCINSDQVSLTVVA
ncbi:MAG: PKD domain-containing protein, partial [Bacteroidia bacterium]